MNSMHQFRSHTVLLSDRTGNMHSVNASYEVHLRKAMLSLCMHYPFLQSKADFAGPQYPTVASTKRESCALCLHMFHFVTTYHLAIPHFAVTPFLASQFYFLNEYQNMSYCHLGETLQRFDEAVVTYWRTRFPRIFWKIENPRKS